jgi:hypothetical protein
LPSTRRSRFRRKNPILTNHDGEPPAVIAFMRSASSRYPDETMQMWIGLET